MQMPTIGRIVVCLNAPRPAIESPGLITRVHDAATVNVTVLPDCDQPHCLVRLRLFEDRAAADAWLATMPGHYPPCAHWPERLPGHAAAAQADAAQPLAA